LSIDAIKGWLADRLTPERLTHVLGVYDTAMHWATVKLNLPEEMVTHIGLAALLHDNAKQWTADRLKTYLNHHNYPWQPEDDKFLAVWHAWAGALEAQHIWGIDHPDVLNAIRFHTTGRPHMSIIEQVVFVADKIEPRTRPALLVSQWHQQVKALPGNGSAQAELANWIKVLLGQNIKYLADRHFAIHPAALAAWNSCIWQENLQNLPMPQSHNLEDRPVVTYPV
jgi:predicted HD superfamily hydrolase involved in NAD metabolism